MAKVGHNLLADSTKPQMCNTHTANSIIVPLGGHLCPNPKVVWELRTENTHTAKIRVIYCICGVEVGVVNQNNPLLNVGLPVFDGLLCLFGFQGLSRQPPEHTSTVSSSWNTMKSPRGAASCYPRTKKQLQLPIDLTRCQESCRWWCNHWPIGFASKIIHQMVKLLNNPSGGTREQ